MNTQDTTPLLPEAEEPIATDLRICDANLRAWKQVFDVCFGTPGEEQ